MVKSMQFGTFDQKSLFSPCFFILDYQKTIEKMVSNEARKSESFRIRERCKRLFGGMALKRLPKPSPRERYPSVPMRSKIVLI